MCLNSPTLPFLHTLFHYFCSTHSYTSYFYEIFATCSCTFFFTKVLFFFVDYGILYEEPLVCAKNTKRVACTVEPPNKRTLWERVFCPFFEGCPYLGGSPCFDYKC